MQELLTQLYSAIGGEAAQAVAQRFDVPKDKADKALPTVAPALFGRLQEMIENPEQNLGALLDLQKKVAATPPSEPPPAAGLSGLIENLLGPQLGAVTSQLGGVLGTSPSQSKGIVGLLVPMVLQFLQKKGDGGSVVDLLAPLLGQAQDGKLKMLAQVLQASGQADDLLGKAGGLLGGLFGK